MTDDILSATVIAPTTDRMSRAYTWQKDLLLSTDDDSEWNAPYNYIYICNLVLDNLQAATQGDDQTRNRLKAEALTQRAYYLFTLANLYGKDYVAESAATDLSVPLMLHADLEAVAKRATVKEVYDQVINDLTAAVATTDFPDAGRNYIHPGKLASMALLARVYLFKGDYVNALKYANEVLAKKSTLFDWNVLSFSNPLKPTAATILNNPLPQNNIENIYSKTASNQGLLTRFMASSDLLSVLDQKDLRYVFNFTRLTSTGAASTSVNPDFLGTTPNFSIGVPEMMLIKAECLARSGDKDGAVALLNALRVKRFKPADYVAVSATTTDDALIKVLSERRRELLFRGVRWFELKRLNRDERFRKNLSRVVSGQTYTLEANSERYLLQIAPKIIAINPLIIQNPR
ncbi:RagB/SusD family nutrient uptake outer membrane protein [Pedobacter sp. HDW13]|uniref:RagB/SusD family nutrient uptake outer membrane protein n=1 Tax=Pedobacter sp. HDW13 TaxID=2714940 RepID=UPI00140DF73E|nr:RagB/SusD family nutrient uptake outer membrane protein [Pedobacter sp. HDW13]QIL40389.1 RagB/SusD family nutrient uptake outer membrane protein [Pedobacter sp. HDW13]